MSMDATLRWLELEPRHPRCLDRRRRQRGPEEGEAFGGLHPVEEPGLEVRLVEHVGRRPALPALRRHLEAQQWHAFAVAPLVGRGRLGEGGRSSPRPQAWRIRAVSSSKCTARGSGYGPGWRSTRSTLHPASRAAATARARPVRHRRRPRRPDRAPWRSPVSPRRLELVEVGRHDELEREVGAPRVGDVLEVERRASRRSHASSSRIWSRSE